MPTRLPGQRIFIEVRELGRHSKWPAPTPNSLSSQAPQGGTAPLPEVKGLPACPSDVR